MKITFSNGMESLIENHKKIETKEKLNEVQTIKDWYFHGIENTTYVKNVKTGEELYYTMEFDCAC